MLSPYSFAVTISVTCNKLPDTFDFGLDSDFTKNLKKNTARKLMLKKNTFIFKGKIVFQNEAELKKSLQEFILEFQYLLTKGGFFPLSNMLLEIEKNDYLKFVPEYAIRSLTQVIAKINNITVKISKEKNPFENPESNDAFANELAAQASAQASAPQKRDTNFWLSMFCITVGASIVGLTVPHLILGYLALIASAASIVVILNVYRNYAKESYNTQDKRQNMTDEERKAFDAGTRAQNSWSEYGKGFFRRFTYAHPVAFRGGVENKELPQAAPLTAEERRDLHATKAEARLR